MTLYTMADAYESADFARRKPMSARAKQAISRALKGKRKKGGMSAKSKKRVGMAAGAAAGLGALALGGRAIMKRRSAKIAAKIADRRSDGLTSWRRESSMNLPPGRSYPKP